MILEFTVGNYRSFRDRYTLSLMATNLKNGPDDKGEGIHETHLVPSGAPLRVLTSAAIYGPNGSGKSNLIAALKFMRSFVLSSSKDMRTGEEIGVEPFLLDDVSGTQPSFFEVIFILDGRRFRYGFEATKHEIVTEWLFGFNKQENTCFIRDENGIQVNHRNFGEGTSRIEFTRTNALFLSLVANLNGAIAGSILGWFQRLTLVSGINDTEYRQVTEQWMKSDHDRGQILRFVRQLDIGISGLTLKVNPGFKENGSGLRTATHPSDSERLRWLESRQQRSFITTHSKFDAQGIRIGADEFDLESQESQGTIKLVYLAGILLSSLRAGDTFIIDEFDARLHPRVTSEIVRMFNSSTTNASGAQLVFATHDTNLLSKGLLRRDQIWLIEKGVTQRSELVALAEYRIEDRGLARHDAPIEDWYLQGRFGAVPNLNSLGAVVEDILTESSEHTEAGEAEVFGPDKYNG